MHKHAFNLEDLENVSEELVCEALKQAIDSSEIDFCTCDICLTDIIAVTLNKVPVAYQANFLEQKLSTAEYQDKIEDLRQKIMQQLPRAIAKVTANTHH